MWQTLSGRLATHCGGWTGCEAGCQHRPSWRELRAAATTHRKPGPRSNDSFSSIHYLTRSVMVSHVSAVACLRGTQVEGGGHILDRSPVHHRAHTLSPWGYFRVCVCLDCGRKWTTQRKLLHTEWPSAWRGFEPETCAIHQLLCHPLSIVISAKMKPISSSSSLNMYVYI